MALVPVSRPLVFGVDQECDAADMFGDHESACPGRQKEVSAQATALGVQVYSQATKPEHRHIVSTEPAAHDFRGSGVQHARGTERVKSEYAFGCFALNGDEALCPSADVILSSVALQVKVEIGIAAVEALTLMVPGKRCLDPGFDRNHARFGACAQPRGAGVWVEVDSRATQGPEGCRVRITEYFPPP